MDLSVFHKHQEMMGIENRLKNDYENNIHKLKDTFDKTDVKGNNNLLKTETNSHHPGSLFQDILLEHTKIAERESSIFNYSPIKKAIDLRTHDRKTNDGKRTIFEDAEYFSKNYSYKLLPITFENVDETIIHKEHNYCHFSINSESEVEEDCSRTMDYNQIKGKYYKKRKTKFQPENDSCGNDKNSSIGDASSKEKDISLTNYNSNNNDIGDSKMETDKNGSSVFGFAEPSLPISVEPLDLSAPLVQSEKTDFCRAQNQPSILNNNANEEAVLESEKGKATSKCIEVTITRPDENEKYQPCDLFLNDVARLVPKLIKKDCFQIDILDRTCNNYYADVKTHRLYYVISESTWKLFKTTNDRVVLTNDHNLGDPILKTELDEKPTFLIFDQISLAKCLSEHCEEIGGCFEYRCVEPSREEIFEANEGGSRNEETESAFGQGENKGSKGTRFLETELHNGTSNLDIAQEAKVQLENEIIHENQLETFNLEYVNLGKNSIEIESSKDLCIGEKKDFKGEQEDHSNEPVETMIKRRTALEKPEKDQLEPSQRSEIFQKLLDGRSEKRTSNKNNNKTPNTGVEVKTTKAFPNENISSQLLNLAQCKQDIKNKLTLSVKNPKETIYHFSESLNENSKVPDEYSMFFNDVPGDEKHIENKKRNVIVFVENEKFGKQNRGENFEKLETIVCEEEKECEKVKSEDYSRRDSEQNLRRSEISLNQSVKYSRNVERNEKKKSPCTRDFKSKDQTKNSVGNVCTNNKEIGQTNSDTRSANFNSGEEKSDLEMNSFLRSLLLEESCKKTSKEALLFRERLKEDPEEKKRKMEENKKEIKINEEKYHHLNPGIKGSSAVSLRKEKISDSKVTSSSVMRSISKVKTDHLKTATSQNGDKSKESPRRGRKRKISKSETQVRPGKRREGGIKILGSELGFGRKTRSGKLIGGSFNGSRSIRKEAKMEEEKRKRCQTKRKNVDISKCGNSRKNINEHKEKNKKSKVKERRSARLKSRKDKLGNRENKEVKGKGNSFVNKGKNR